MLKNITLIFLLLYCNNLYSKEEISFLNNQDENIQIEFIVTRLEVKSLFRGQEPMFDLVKTLQIPSGNSSLISLDEEFYIFNKNIKLKIDNSGTECYWIYIFNFIKKTHGYFLRLFINDQEMGKICATKYSSVDYKVHANLELGKNSSNLYVLKFYNSGWWGEKTIETEELEVILDYDVKVGN
ncbi:hypothetical protein QEJ31_05870 [Pigmentibacter sp. JX0631]|uniref:hypothetical protein n=1 Tax=Pigmentibacter sp. JX0631 TaxID=2976982 RepID=UPI0024699F45|nr:hypothetical protein [Pigmentibacter sp. JX0631]WGL61122.1 hypothetical protein QEJ31_05870 [Pigmentibacter sp. JX0631]